MSKKRKEVDVHDESDKDIKTQKIGQPYACSIIAHGVYTNSETTGKPITVLSDIKYLFNELYVEVNNDREQTLHTSEKKTSSKWMSLLNPSVYQEVITKIEHKLLNNIRLISGCRFGSICINVSSNHRNARCYSDDFQQRIFKNTLNKCLKSGQTLETSINITRNILRLVNLLYLYFRMDFANVLKPNKTIMNILIKYLNKQAKESQAIFEFWISVIRSVPLLFQNWNKYHSYIPDEMSNMKERLYAFITTMVNTDFEGIILDTIVHENRSKTHELNRINSNTYVKSLQLHENEGKPHANISGIFLHNGQNQLILMDAIEKEEVDVSIVVENAHAANELAKKSKFEPIINKLIDIISNTEDDIRSTHVFLLMILLNWENDNLIPILDLACSITQYDETEDINGAPERIDSSGGKMKKTKKKKQTNRHRKTHRTNK